MTIRRHYINDATVTSLTASITNAATSLTVAAATTFPASFPWTAVIDSGTVTAEVVLVTAAVGTTLTVTRGYDGTTAQAHANAATFAHVAVKSDYDEANAHVVATTGVHGIVGAVVGDTDGQTLTNKTLASPTVTGNLPVSGNVAAVGNVTAGGNITATGNLAAANFPVGLVAMESGLLTITPVANTPTAGAVTFTAGRFAAAPHVFATAVSALPGTRVVEVTVTSITTAGCTVEIDRTDTFDTTVQWLAVSTN